MSDSKNRSEPQEAADARLQPDGVLRVTTGSLKLPEGLAAEHTASEHAIDRVVLVIVVLALTFIGVIAWLIHMGQ
jgi:hypothetical protein